MAKFDLRKDDGCHGSFGGQYEKTPWRQEAVRIVRHGSNSWMKYGKRPCMRLCVCVRERRKIELKARGKQVPIPLDGIRTCASGAPAQRARACVCVCHNEKKCQTNGKHDKRHRRVCVRVCAVCLCVFMVKRCGINCKGQFETQFGITGYFLDILVGERPYDKKKVHKLNFAKLVCNFPGSHHRTLNSV